MTPLLRADEETENEKGISSISHSYTVVYTNLLNFKYIKGITIIKSRFMVLKCPFLKGVASFNIQISLAIFLFIYVALSGLKYRLS
jgi:hypothetical protein